MTDDFFSNIDGGFEDFQGPDSAAGMLALISELPEPTDSESLPSTEPKADEVQLSRNVAIESMKNAQKITELALRQVFILAKSSDSPRAWEVLSTLLKTNIDASKTILDSTEPKSNNIETQNNVTNNIQNTIIQSSEDIFSFLNEDDPVEMIDVSPSEDQ